MAQGWAKRKFPMKQTKWSAVGCKEQQRPLEAEQGPDIGSREGHDVKLGKQRCDWGKRELGQDGDFFIFFLATRTRRTTDFSHWHFSFGSVIILIASAHHHPTDAPCLSYPSRHYRRHLSHLTPPQFVDCCGAAKSSSAMESCAHACSAM